MYDEDNPPPVVHRVRTEADARKEAQMGLDLLLAQGQALLSREARERALKKLEDESEATRQRRMRLAQLQAERFEWKPVAAAVVFEEQICLYCGTIHSMFRGFGTIMQRKANFAERFLASEGLDRGLPFQKRTLSVRTPTCADCLEEFCAEGAQGNVYEFHPNRKEHSE